MQSLRCLAFTISQRIIAVHMSHSDIYCKINFQSESYVGLAYYPCHAGLERPFGYDRSLVSAVRRGHLSSAYSFDSPWYGHLLRSMRARLGSGLRASFRNSLRARPRTGLHAHKQHYRRRSDFLWLGDRAERPSSGHVCTTTRRQWSWLCPFAGSDCCWYVVVCFTSEWSLNIKFNRNPVLEY